MKNKASILVFLENKPFLGRQISQIPFFEHLKLFFPEHQVIGISPNKKSSEILEYFKLMDEVLYYDEIKNNIKKNIELLRFIKAQRPQILFQLRKNSDRYNIISRFIKCQKKIGFKSTTSFLLSESHQFEMSKYVSYNYMKLLNLNEIYTKRPVEEIYNRCVIIPIAGGPRKVYPISKYIEICHEIEKILPVTFIIQSKYSEIKKILLSNFSKNKILCNIDLKTLKDYILHSKIVLSNDCGPVHFAHIYNIPRIILYKDKGDKIGGPISQWFNDTEEAVKIVSKTGNIDDIEVYQITNTFKTLYSNLYE